MTHVSGKLTNAQSPLLRSGLGRPGGGELILLQPTTPFRSSQHLDAALKKFVSSRPKSQTTLVSVTKIPKKAHWLLKKINKNYIRLLNNKITKYVNRQDVKDLYIPNGAIYICKIKLHSPGNCVAILYKSSIISG